MRGKLSEEDRKIVGFLAKRTTELWKEGTDYWDAVDKAFIELKSKRTKI
jgi:hypothetical protein